MSKPQKRRFRKMRAAILAENGGLCAICNIAPATTLDHILPRSAGGTNERRNLRGACAECNQKKADTVPPDAPPPGEQALSHRAASLRRPRRIRPSRSEQAWEGCAWNGEWLTPLPRRGTEGVH